LLFQREGYRAERLVLLSTRVEGAATLDPGEIRVRLAPLVPVERGIVIEAGEADEDTQPGNAP
jgi:hypothetical protein